METHCTSFPALVEPPLVDENHLLGQSGVLPSNYPNIRIAPASQAGNAFISVPNISSPGDQPGRVSAISEYYWGNDYGIPDYVAGFRSTDHGLSWQGGEHLLVYSGARAKSPSLARVEWPPYELDLVAGFADNVLQLVYSGDFGYGWEDAIGWPSESPQDASLLGTDPPSSTLRVAYATFAGAVLFRRSESAGWSGWNTTAVISAVVPGYGRAQGVSVLRLEPTDDELFACWALLDATNERERELRFSHSTNGGLSWATPSYIFAPGFKGVFGNHKGVIDPIRFHSNPSADVDRTRNTVYVSWTNEVPPATPGPDGGIEPEPEDRFRPTEVRFTKSTDGGHTWTGWWGTVHPPSPKTDSWSPKLHVDNGGGVNVLFYDSRRDTTNNKETQVYLARSTDQGVSWKNYSIADAWFVPKPVGESNSEGGSALGVSSSDDYLYLTWNDSRTNIQQPYFARFPLRTTVIEDQPFVGWQMLLTFN